MLGRKLEMVVADETENPEQGIAAIKKLTGDVDIKAFFPGGDYAPLKELLVEYRTISRHIRYEFIDPDKQPDVAK